MPHICVFCGSQGGNDPVYAEDAQRIAKALHAQGAGLVFGGGREGLMNAVAKTMAALGSQDIVAVAPLGWAEGKDRLSDYCQRIHYVESLAERKKLMFDASDAFICLPGGLGTLDELFEALSSLRLGLHQKPVGLLNTRDFFAKMLAFLHHTKVEGFTDTYLGANPEDSFLVENSPQELVEKVLSRLK